MKKRSLAFRLMLSGVLAVLIPLVVVAGAGVINSTEALEKQGASQVSKVAAALAETAQSILSQEVKLVKEMALDTLVTGVAAKVATEGSLAASEMQTLASNWLTKAGKSLGNDYEMIIVADKNGQTIADSNSGKSSNINVADREYFKAAMQGKSTISAPIKSKISGHPVVAVASPVRGDDGRINGMLATVIQTTEFSKKITSIRVGETGYPWMVDQKGVFVAHPNPKNILTLNASTLGGMETVIKRMLAGESGIEEYDFKGFHKICGFAPVPITGWSVAFTQNIDEFMAPAYHIRNISLIIGVIALVLTVVGVLWLTRSITKPISSAARELEAGSSQVAAASTEVAQSGQSLAEGTSEQAASIEETSASLEEITSMTRQNAEHASEADSLMGAVGSQTKTAGQSMSQMRQSMDEIAQAGEEISKIIKSIDEIAFQTNLLALNAAVEAARAGEAGAGFAVVADEVRSLAMRAAEAAKNTAELIAGTITRIDHGVNLAKEVDGAFSEVAENATKAAGLVSEIAAASNEQAQGIDQISKAVTAMDQVTQNTAASAEESAAAAEELSAQSEEIASIASRLMFVVYGSKKASGDASKLTDRVVPKIEHKKTAAAAIQRTANPHPAAARTKKGALPLDDEDFADF
ncbi:methyl-accepting chemotaxis protein [Dethiosulfatarculus sandiegensis]|uniref:Methyl-accepting chemotaxis protein n=1 Tax=Dethiosulfatarculus sandiegensis TaxID=1429043 RepID=A0A0D2JTE4_9BACT|nr:methyl-accepting chemotaxis protein [Dethiosulfatarculus sandiegensis]KIX12775.1 methyl-accepting chemotaxis protein [Dethiosulfatarculus sandiegensis]